MANETLSANQAGFGGAEYPKSPAEGAPVLNIRSESHLFGETIAEHGFPEEYDQLLDVLGGTDVPLRDAEPFTSQGRPATPKRQAKKIGGRRAYALFPIDQAGLNQHLHDQLRARGWNAQPVAAGRPLGTPADLALRGDFAKRGVFVEVEFGNSASLFRDLFKFQIASRSGVGEVAVLIVATAQTAKFFDSGVTTFEQAVGLLPYMQIGIQMPVWVIGIEPSSWADVRNRYEDMYRVATENGVAAHEYDTVSGASLEAVASLGDEATETSTPDPSGDESEPLNLSGRGDPASLGADVPGSEEIP